MTTFTNPHERIEQLMMTVERLEVALDWALGNGVAACRGEVSGHYSFVKPGDGSEDFDDIDPPTNLADLIGESATRCFERLKEVKAVTQDMYSVVLNSLGVTEENR